MQVVTPDLVKGKKVLLRLDLDVAIQNGEIIEDFKIQAGIPTPKLCIQNASKVIILGHLGRPFKVVEDEKGGRPENLSLKPVFEWFKKQGFEMDFAQRVEQVATASSQVVMLENTRFFHGEIPGPQYHHSCTSKTCDIDFAKKLASLGDFYVNEAFSSYRPAASTTMLPSLLPHAAGLRFVEEVKKLTEVRENPKKPFIAIMGGGGTGKDEEKFPVIKVLAQKADAVLVGGKLVHEINEQGINLPSNVMVGKLTDNGFDIAPETVESWNRLIMQAKMIIWNGPLGKFEDPKNDATKKVAELVVESGAETIVGGGDIIAALNQAGVLDKISFVSTGGGAMLKLLSEGTLETIEALS
ncbi:phosphoglycerate kinase [Candidatus Daviesbacteria bacterium]|nr:phosphoglycerate kinase [Candidatus Daviesbacteria bacterium]